MVATTVLPTQPLREEHHELLPHIEQLAVAADAIGHVPIDELRKQTGEAYAFLTEHLIPHAQAEDAVLYPVVARLMGAPEATATMRRDHVAVMQLTERLGACRDQLVGTDISEALAMELRRILYGLYTLVQVHFAKEEEIYLPLLDTRITAEEAQHLFEDMAHAAHG